MNLSILYRGPLSSCNYDCGYCPFAKRLESHGELRLDRDALARFVAWAAAHADIRLGVLFTPWGEALIRPWYQDALIQLSNLPHVRKVAIQTNLSCKLDWVEACDHAKLALWTTYHPGETTRSQFLDRCQELERRGVRYSVGVVGLKEHRAEIEAMRRELPGHVYLWINAAKDRPDEYDADDVRRFTAIDPLFPVNNTRHPSLGRPCDAGETVISVDGDGVMRRCHFIKEPIGNLYADDFADALRPRRCTNATCGCHIGYVHMPELKMATVFGDGLLERIPAVPLGQTPRRP
jgi:hypothetical protein